MKSNLKRKVKEFSKRSFRKIFEIGQRIGVDILPHHFYSGVPDLKELRDESYWKKPYSMAGINGADIESQLNFIEQCCSPYLIQRQKREDIYNYACEENGEAGFGPIEADFLFCFIFSKRPQRIVQVGCGVSTAIIMLATKEANYSPEIICIDPYPTKFLQESNRLNKIKLITEKTQLVNLDTLVNLGDSGFLFVDSTHAVKPGSEVNKLMLEVLLRLKVGNWVHFHDIYFPYDYSRRILSEDLFYSNETVLLHAFLTNNYKYLLRVSFGMLHYADPARLKRFLPNYQPAKNDYGMEISKGHFPSSVYLEVIE